MQIYEAMGAKAIDKKDPKRKEKIEALFKNPRFVGQRKWNGERLMAFKDTDENETVRLFGRGTSKYGERMEKTHLLPHLVAELQWLPSGTFLDGEVLFIPDKYSTRDIRNFTFIEDFKKCREIMGSYEEKAVSQQSEEGHLHYFVFDILEAGGIPLINDRYQYRDNILQNVFRSVYDGDSEFIHYVPYVTGEDNKRNLLTDALNLGLEGIILKNLDGFYYPGKKPTNQWVKVKRVEDTDGVIMGYHRPNQYTEITRNNKKVLDEFGKPVLEESRYYRNNWIGAIWIGQLVREDKVTVEQQKIFKFLQDQDYKERNYKFLQNLCYPMLSLEYKEDGVKYLLIPVVKISGIPDSLREHISQHLYDYLGKIVKLEYFEQTEDSYFQPRFQCFRDDKQMKECMWE